MVKIHMASRKNLTIPQSRVGRRPMSVGTMLRKEQDGSLFKLKSVGADLSEARTKTINTIQDWVKKNRYSQAIDDIETITEKISGDYGKNGAGYDLQGRTEVQGLSIAIENKPGSKRSGKNDDGSTWETTFKSPYGYIEGTLGADGEEIDAYVGPDKDSTQVFIVHQRKSNGSHDEDTVMLGYANKGDAKTDIMRHYEDTSLIGGIDQMSIEDFKAKLDKADGKAIAKIAAMPHLRLMQFYTDASKEGAKKAGPPRYLTESDCRARARQHMAKSATLKEHGSMLETVQPDRDRIVNRLKKLMARRSPDPEKTASGLASEQANLDYREGDSPDSTGTPAQLGRKPWEGPSRLMQDPYPKPSVENRQENQETKLVGSLLSPEGYDDVGKCAELGAERALGQERRSWEGPTQDEVGVSSSGKHLLHTGRGVTTSDLSPEVKVAMLEQAVYGALRNELQKIAQASGQPVWDDFEKFASSELVDSLVKEAIFRQMAGGLSRGLMGGVSPQGVPMKGLLSGFKGVGHKMEQAGTQMMTSPAQRIQAAGASAGEAQQLAGQAARFGVKAPGVAKRVGGEAVQTAGKHVAHSSPLQLALNPIGTAIGGGIEGATRGAGRELTRAAGPASRIRAGVGNAMQRHAGKAGVIGEIGTMGAMGGLMHMPLSAAGALGGGIAHAAPAIGSGLAHLGAVGGHVGADAIGTIAQKAGKLLPHAGRAAGKLMQAAT